MGPMEFSERSSLTHVKLRSVGCMDCARCSWRRSQTQAGREFPLIPRPSAVIFRWGQYGARDAKLSNVCGDDGGRFHPRPRSRHHHLCRGLGRRPAGNVMAWKCKDWRSAKIRVTGISVPGMRSSRVVCSEATILAPIGCFRSEEINGGQSRIARENGSNKSDFKAP
jgi:hypothetical protein